MKKFLKSSLSLVLALTIILSSALVGLGEVDFCSAFAVTASAASVNDLNFKLNADGESYSVASCSTLASVELVIPSTYNGLTVTSIGDRAFGGCTNLTSITIPDGVTSIGISAFGGCTNLTSITIPDSVTSIGNGAFYNCKSLTSINVEENNKYYSSVNGVLFNKNKAVLIQYPIGKTEIEYVIPNSVTRIGKDAFCNCTSLTSVTIPDSVTSIGDYAFNGCISLTTVTIPDGVTNIGDDTFGGCNSLASITIPDSVTSIGDYAFSCCSSLTSVTIPNSVTSIGKSAFYNCKSLTSINVEENNKYYSSVNGVLFNKNKTVLIQYPIGKTEIEYVIPNSVTRIGKDAFCNCTSLTSVTIGSGVTSIEDSAFEDCSKLTKVYYYGTSVQWGKISIGLCNTKLKDATRYYYLDGYGFYSISGSCGDNISYFIEENGTLVITGEGAMIDYFSEGDSPFYNKTNIKSVIVEDGVTSIGNHAFYGCTNLTSVTIGNSVTSIGDSAFNSCKSLASITIPDSVTSIGEFAFEDCTNLTSVTIPDSVTSIDGGAFRDCVSLTSITIPGGVTSIDDWTFGRCTSLTSITIPDSVTSIGYCALHGCTSLTTITIPNSVKSIDEQAFYNCSRLASVIIGDGVISIGDGAFCSTAYYNNESNWTDEVLYIGNYLIKAEITANGDYVVKDGTKIIADYAFSNCSDLTAITIADSVTIIGNYAFSGCNKLTQVYYYGTPIQWRRINIGSYNTKLTSAKKNYYIEGYGFTTSVWLCGENVIYYLKEDGTLVITGEGAMVDYDSSYSPFYNKKNNIKSVVIEDGVTNISNYSFNGCTSLTSVTIPDSVTTIGDYAFYGCTSLTSVTIPDSVINIGIDAFYNTGIYNNNENWEDDVLYIGNHFIKAKKSLSGAYSIKEGIISIAGGAFASETNFTSITIPDSVTSIGEKAFYDCSYLKYVFYTGTKDEWENIKKGSYNTFGKSTVFHFESSDHTPTDWITDKNATASAAGSKHKECTVCKAVLEKATIPQLKCAAPKLTKIENASNGIKITWGKVSGAQSYNVYRKTYSNGKWSGWSGIKYGATGTSYTDTTAKSGTTYLYTVRAKNAAGLSSYNTTGLKIKFLSTPKLTSISNGSGKVTVKWNKVTGASGYYVYRQTYSNGKWSGWKKVATIKNTYYNDTNVSSGKYYKYTVRAYNGSYISYYNTTGLKIKYLAAPKISSASSRRDGILINWNKISGASGYYVYRKAPSRDWKKIATIKGNTTIKYLDETPRKGVTYQYCVKAYSGNYTSTYANTYKITCKY